MKEVKTPSGTVVSLFSSVHDLPIDRYNALRKYSLQDMEIGSDLMAVERHYRTFDRLLAAGEHTKLNQDRINLQNSLYLAIEQINIKHISFACFINKIDDHYIFGKDDAITEDGLIRAVKLLETTKIKQGDVEDILIDLKKKLNPNFGLYSLKTETIRRMQSFTSNLEKKQLPLRVSFKDRLKLSLLKLKSSKLMKRG